MVIAWYKWLPIQRKSAITLKLIGAGLGRTGTLSLKVALEEIGLDPCFHMTEVLMNPSCSQAWVQAAEGRLGWDAVLGNFAATVDYPGCTFWKELMRSYPDAKVLLSVRDPAEWFESTQQTIFSQANTARILNSPMKEFFVKTVYADFGEHLHDRDFMIAAFRRRNAEVERFVPPERLLVYEVSQGWAPLCKFLDVPVPKTPFPRTNSREEFGAPLRSLEQRPAGAPPDDPAIAKLIREKLDGLRQRND